MLRAAVVLAASAVAYAPLRPAAARPATAVRASAAPMLLSMPEGLEIPADLGAIDNILADERARKGPSEFELNLGRCIDALRVDIENFPDRELRWEVYTDDVVLADPNAVQATGLAAYKQFFSMLRTFRRFMIDAVEVTYKLRYDWSGKRVVVTWYSAWTMKGRRAPTHVDAVSYFHLDDRGLIFKHEVDRVSINGKDVTPPYGGAWEGLRARLFDGLAPREPAPTLACDGPS